VLFRAGIWAKLCVKTNERHEEDPGNPMGTPTWHKRGSSRNTGERSPDFEEEILLIPVAVGSALDDRDGAVDSLDSWC